MFTVCGWFMCFIATVPFEALCCAVVGTVLRVAFHKVCHPRCVYNILGCVYICLTQLYGGIDMYNLLHKDQLHVSAPLIGHLQVDN